MKVIKMDGILNIYKEQGYTSHDVVACVRKILNIKKVGHTGTLDPMATGVLLVCVGKATKASEYIMGSDKVYLAGFKLGMTTETEDITGKVLSSQNVSVKKETLQNVLQDYQGEIEQIPPMYSAVKIDGKKLYQLARSGVEVNRPSRKVTIFQIDLISFDETTGEGIMRIRCSKGTYIRTVCSQVGQQLGCGAVMTSLCRERNGNYDLSGAHTLAQLADIVKKDEITKHLLPIDSVFLHYPKILLNRKLSDKIKNGVAISLSDIENLPADQKTFRVYDDCGNFLQIASADGENKRLKSEKNFF